MEKFKQGQRVRVQSGDLLLDGRTGTVTRLRFKDDMAWILMDIDLPPTYQTFAPWDPRARWILLRPDQCQPLDEDPVPRTTGAP